MDKQTQTNTVETSPVEEHAQALLDASAGVGGEKLEEARRRLAAALERGKAICNQVREKVVEGAKTTDEAVHKHPYEAIGIALGVGALVGYLVARRRPGSQD